MVTYMYGPDVYGARSAIDVLTGKNTVPIRWVDKRDLEAASLETILDGASGGLFGEQLVVVRDPSTFPKGLQEQVTATVKAKRDASWVLWDRQKTDKRSKLYKEVKKDAQEFPQLTAQEAVSWLTKAHTNVEAAAAQELVQRLGVDRFRLQHEVEKLLLMHDTLTVAIVREEVPTEHTSDEIFPFLEALSGGNPQKALQLLDELLLAGNSELYIISMLGYQYKTLLAIAANRTQGLHPFVVQKNGAIARRYSVGNLRNIITRLAATDFAIKQGKVDQRTALVMLVLTLASGNS